MPAGVEDRDADVWEALLAVADLGGEVWAKAARVAAVTLVTASRHRPPSIGVLLLHDIKKVFDKLGGDDAKAPTETILAGLVAMTETPWATLRKGEPIDSRSLSVRLGKYGIGSKPQRVGDDVFKGYSRTQFEDAWKRYLTDLPDDDDDQRGIHGDVLPDESPAQGNPSVTSVTTGASAAVVTDVTDTNGSTRVCACGADLLPDNHTGQCAECRLCNDTEMDTAV